MSDIVIIQARTNSSRFKNKIMEKIGEMPMVRMVYNTCISTGLHTVVAVPTGDPVIKYLKENKIPFYEGSEANVLERYYDCAVSRGAPDWIYRVTADCPLLDLTNLMFLIGINKDKLNWAQVTGIDGQDVEACRFTVLEQAVKGAESDEDREHVFPWIKRNVKESLTYYIPYETFKMSVDTKEDLKRVREIYASRNLDILSHNKH